MEEDTQCAGRAIEAGHLESACSLWWRFEERRKRGRKRRRGGFLLVGRVRGTKDFFFPLVVGTHAKTLGFLSLDVNIISSTKNQIPFPKHGRRKRRKEETEPAFLATYRESLIILQ